MTASAPLSRHGSVSRPRHGGRKNVRPTGCVPLHGGLQCGYRLRLAAAAEALCVCFGELVSVVVGRVGAMRPGRRRRLMLVDRALNGRQRGELSWPASRGQGEMSITR